MTQRPLRIIHAPEDQLLVDSISKKLESEGWTVVEQRKFRQRRPVLVNLRSRYDLPGILGRELQREWEEGRPSAELYIESEVESGSSSGQPISRENPDEAIPGLLKVLRSINDDDFGAIHVNNKEPVRIGFVWIALMVMVVLALVLLTLLKRP